MISYDDFAKLDIRIGTIISAEKVQDTDKLLRLSVDLGEEKPRQIIAGIAEYVDPVSLAGRQIPILANLEPRMIRGFESQGMILAAGGKEGSLALLHPHVKLPNGSGVR